MKRICAILFASFLCGIGYAQHSDSVHIKQYPPLVRHSETTPGWEADSSLLDTSLGNFHRYYPNYVWMQANAGNIGLAVRPLAYEANNQSLNFGWQRYGNSFYRDSDVEYFKPLRPFTYAFFAAGPNNEQNLSAIHTQRIREGWHAGIGFNLFGAEGAYTDQTSGYNHFRFFSSYDAPSNRYGVYANLIYNRLRNLENGGFVDPTSFEDPEVINREGLSTNLSSASSRLATFGLNFHQYWQFGPGMQDSVSTDSHDRSDRIVAKMRVQHDLNFNQIQSSYRDDAVDSSYYSPLFTYLDSVGLYDSLHQNVLSNRVRFSVLGEGGRKKIHFDVTHRYFDHWQNDSRRSYNQLSPGIQIDFLPKDTSGISALVWAEYILVGHSATGYRGLAKAEKPGILGLSKVSASVEVQEMLPNLVYLDYATDFYSWSNNLAFNRIVKSSIEGTRKDWKLNFGTAYMLQDRVTYFDSTWRPVQASSNTGLLQFWAEKQFDAGNWHIKLKGWYQDVSGNDVLRVPTLMGMGSTWFESLIFKRKMLFRFGVDAFYHSKYYGLSYAPVTRQFYVQDDQKIGDYPFIDTYIAFKVKQVRVFAKLEHVTQGLFGYSYFMVPGMPQPGRSFKFGVSWAFFD